MARRGPVGAAGSRCSPPSCPPLEVEWGAPLPACLCAGHARRLAHGARQCEPFPGARVRRRSPLAHWSEAYRASFTRRHRRPRLAAPAPPEEQHPGTRLPEYWPGW
eukprot:scaffold5285_cov249-Prasinococcus_capsulatus_cf.AAC.1